MFCMALTGQEHENQCERRSPLSVSPNANVKLLKKSERGAYTHRNRGRRLDHWLVDGHLALETASGIKIVKTKILN